MNNLILRDPFQPAPVTTLLPSIFSRQLNRMFQSPFGWDTGLSNAANGPSVNVYETKAVIENLRPTYTNSIRPLALDW